MKLLNYLVKDNKRYLNVNVKQNTLEREISRDFYITLTPHPFIERKLYFISPDN